jgi:hypothetical protein
VHDPEHTQGEQRRADRDPRARFRAGVGGHHQHAGAEQQHRQHDGCAADDVADGQRQPLPDRAAGLPPDAGRADHRQHHQHDAHAVAAVGRVELAGPPHRATQRPPHPGDAAADPVDGLVEQVGAALGRRLAGGGAARRRPRGPAGRGAPRRTP